MGKKNCVICGKEGHTYLPFCYEHLQEKNAGKIIKCECGTWHYSDQPCQKCGGGYSNNNPSKPTDTPSESRLNDLTCIICGEPSNGKHFCKTCYAKYKDRSIDIRISHCTDTEILDEYGNRTIMCNNGVRVRSRAEKIIADKLFELNVRTVYEKTVYYSKDGENKTLHPDFYLPDYDLYIEYNEITNKPYLKSKEYTKKIYEELGYKVVIMTNKELDDIESFIKPLLGLH